MPRRKITQELPKIKDTELVEYAIYARKSTEDDEKQKASIPQQLEQCFHYAQNNNLPLKPRPLDFPPEDDIIRQIEEAYASTPEKCDEIRTKYIEHFVVGEVKSAKIPTKRDKWNMLINRVKLGQVRGLLGYAPDRFARNLQEGGEVIQLADDRAVRLKFTSFAFENNSSGHMMLGIFFVFAEHYSKKLSEDSMRGTKQKSLEGKRCGARKIGYVADDEDYFIPHPTNFPILQKAFKRKIYDEWSDEAIAEEMDRDGWKDINAITGKRISQLQLWDDTFYYGLWTREFRDGETIKIDLRTKGCGFTPAICEEEFELLQEKLVERNRQSKKRRNTLRTKRLDIVTPLPNGMIQNEKGANMNFTLPNPKRFERRLATLQKKKPEATLVDVVEPHQIKFKTVKNTTKTTNSINFDVVDTFIHQHFKRFKITEELKQAYLYALHQEIEKEFAEEDKKQRRITLLKNKNKGEERKFLRETNFGANLASKDKNLWETKTSGKKKDRSSNLERIV